MATFQMSIEEIVSIRILMKTINYAANEIAKFDENYKNQLKEIDSIIIWKIGRDLTLHTQIKDGEITSGEGEIDNASIAIEIGSTTEALEMLTGKSEIADLVKKAKVAGDAEEIQQNLFILEKVKDYLGDLVGGKE